MQNGSIIFLKLVLVFLIGVISKPLTAQIDTQKSDKLEKSASESALEESDTPYTSMLAPAPQKVQNLPLIVANAAIRYKNSATVYLYLNHVELATAFYMESPTVGKRINIDMPPTGEVVLKGMPKETDFTLFAVVDGNAYKIASVTTKPDALGSITVSNMLYEEAVKWQIMKSRPKLFDHIQSSKEVNVYEKTAFLQQFYMADKDLADESPDGSVSFSDLGGDGSSFALLGGCNCKLLLNYAQLPIPYNGISASSGSLNTTNWGNSTVWSDVSSMNVLQFGNSSGANKYTQFQTNGKRLSGREISFNSVEVGNTQTAAFLDYSLVCEYGEDPGVDCGCAKNVDIMYQFDAHLRTDGALTQCFLCGSRASHSLIEEAVALTILNHRDKSSIVVAAKRAEAKTEVNRTVNSDFFVTAIQLAAEVGKLFLPQAEINSTAVDKISTALQNLIKQPLNTGGGTSSVFKANMVDDRYFFKLLPNQPIRVALASLTKATLGGATAWQNKVESNTDFALAGIVTIPRVEDKSDPNCCSPKIANWVLGGFEGSVVNQANLRQKVGVFLNTYAPWRYLTNDPFTNAIVIPKDMGSTEHPICSKTGIIVGPLDPQALKGKTVGTTWTVAQKDNVMLIQNAQNKEPFNYTIWDGLGRLILSGKSASAVTQTTFELPDISSGMYLLRVEQDKNTYTSKFTKF